MSDVDPLELLLDDLEWDWPHFLTYYTTTDFGNEELNQLIYDAVQTHGVLEGYRKQIEDRATLLLEKKEEDWMDSNDS